MFTPSIRKKLKHYVYLYVDPRTNTPFYIGKGKDNRAFSHRKDKSESKKVRVIKELGKLGLEPRIEILKHGLSENQALLVEATAIDLLDVTKLTNKVRGHGSRHGARATVDQVCAQLDVKEASVDDPAILITISRRFYYGMSPQELYDATRCSWKVGHRRERARYALSVYQGIVREVYSISGWVRGGSTMRSIDKDGRREDIPERWEFVGRVAEEPIRRRYLGKSVAKYFKKGAQNPIKYVKC